MARSLGEPSGSGGAAPGRVVAAERVRRRGWRDPRLWVGVAIVAASVVVGARVLATADDTVAVWAVSSDVGPGQQLGEEDLVAHRVRFGDAADAEAYFTVDDTLPADLELTRAVAAGELLPRSAVGADTDDLVEVSVPVAPLRVPTDVTAGSVVDVYVGSSGGGGSRRGGAGGGGDVAEPDLDGVTVVDAPLAQDALVPSGDRQLVLAVPADDVPALLGDLDTSGGEEPLVWIVRHRS